MMQILTRRINSRIKQHLAFVKQQIRPYSHHKYDEYERPHTELRKDIILYVTSHWYPLLPLKAEFAFPVKDHISDLRPFRERFSSVDGRWEFSLAAAEEEGSKTNAVKSSLLFSKGYKALLDYVLLPEDCHDLSRFFPEPIASALLALERFYIEKGNQEVRLKKVCDSIEKYDGLTESDIASVFANHLFSQLNPCQTSYHLDLKSKGKTAFCPCGCGKMLNFGVSQLGSRELFYGSVDLVIFPSDKDDFTDNNNGHKCALFTLGKKDESIEWYSDEEFYDGESEGECELKSFDKITREKIYKQSIAMSLCKRNRLLQDGSRDEADTFITPVCGFNGSSYTLVVYDAEDDCLLTMAGNCEIFDGVYLKSSAILDIWLLIHHNLFCSKPPQSVQKQLQDSCGLKNLLGHQMYENVVLDSNWRYDSYRPFKTPEICIDEINPLSKLRYIDENIDFSSDVKHILKDRLPNMPKKLVRDLDYLFK